MKDKIKKLFVDFSEEFDLSSFFCITTTYYKDINRINLKALGEYKYEIDMYLMEKGFSHKYDELYNWDKYSKGDIEVTLMDK